jgi:hypothetical protein
MINRTTLITAGHRIDSQRSNRRSQPGGAKRRSAVEPMRIARGNQVIGKWSLTEVKERLENEDLLFTDSFYDEGTSDWLLLSELKVKQTFAAVEKSTMRPCYCGTGLPFQVCCGDRTNC